MRLKKLRSALRGNRRGKQEESDHQTSLSCAPFPIGCGRKNQPKVVGTPQGTRANPQPEDKEVHLETKPADSATYRNQQSNTQTQESTSVSSGRKTAAKEAPKKVSRGRSLPLHPSQPSSSKGPQTILRNTANRRNSISSQKMASINFSKSGTAKENVNEEEAMSRMYDLIPQLEVTQLPRGGISIETKAIGQIQVSRPCKLMR